MEVLPGTGREDEIYQEPVLSLGSDCVRWGIQKTVISKWSLILLQELSLKKLLSKVFCYKSGTEQLRVQQGQQPKDHSPGREGCL